MKLMVFGDSLVAGYNLHNTEAYPTVLQNRLHEKGYEHITVINRGVSGDTTSGGLSRLIWTLNRDKPDLFILELGANDMLRATSPALTKNNLDEILRIVVKEYKIPTMLLGMYADPVLGNEFISAYDFMYRDLAAKYDVIVYPFFLEGVVGNKDLLLPDNLHPNNKGVELMVENTLPDVMRFIDKTEKQ